VERIMSFDDLQISRSGLAFRRCGAGAPVVLLHGIPGSSASWEGTVAHLADRLDVVVPDLLGFGGSTRPEGLAELHAAAQARAVHDLVTELRLFHPVVIGHDFGGPVALMLRKLRPSAVSALGLLAANAFTDTPIPLPLSPVTWPAVGPAYARLLFSGLGLGAMLRSGVGDGATVLDAATHLGDARQQAATRTIFAGSLQQLAGLYRPIEEQLRSVAVPAFVGWGDRDPFFSVDHGRRTAREAGGDFHLYEGAGHFLPQERPSQVADDIAALVATAAAR
jgi:pimeloyl-ACP methyl ester carboxylesterase